MGLTAGWQGDEIQVDFKIFKIPCRFNYLDFLLHLISVQCYYSIRNAFQSAFAYFKVCFEVHKIWLPFFPCRSLLLNTSILNDMYTGQMKNTYLREIHWYLTILS